MRSTWIAGALSAGLHGAGWLALAGVRAVAPAAAPSAVMVEVASPPPVRETAREAAASTETETKTKTETKAETVPARRGAGTPPARRAIASGPAGTSGSAPSSSGERETPSPAPRAPDLFAGTALGRAAGIDVGAAPPDEGYRPRRGVGGRSGRGDTDPSAFLAEDAARDRAARGLVPPRVRDLERRLEATFDPPFAKVDPSNRRELLHKQFMARLGRPPKVRELRRGEDPALESDRDKRERIAHEPYFLGRRTEVFARQRDDGTILDLAIRVSSGSRTFDEEALASVERALRGHRPDPADVHGGEVRTLWRLDATAYVVYAATPSAIIDESTGKVEMVYPLEKRVSREVRLLAIY